MGNFFLSPIKNRKSSIVNPSLPLHSIPSETPTGCHTIAQGNALRNDINMISSHSWAACSSHPLSGKQPAALPAIEPLRTYSTAEFNLPDPELQGLPRKMSVFDYP